MKRKHLVIIGLVSNILLPGLGTLLCGVKNKGIVQLLLAIFGIALANIALMMENVALMIISMPVLLITIGWSLLTSIQLIIKENKKSKEL